MVRLRWMVRRDVPEVMAIEQASFEHPWSESELDNYVRARNVIVMVAEDEECGCILGYVVYATYKTHLEVDNIAVHPEFRRRGIGRQMLEKLKRRVDGHSRRSSIMMAVREKNLLAQVFARECGLRCCEVSHAFYDGPEDAYVFVWRGSRDAGFNRIKSSLGV